MEPSSTPTGGVPAADAHTYRMPLPRLALPPDVSHDPLDGARWPRCAALELELPSLVGSLEPDPNTAVRVTVEPAGPGSAAHVITLDCGTERRWVLLVVPPEEPAGTAARLPAAAADPENPLTAARMLTLAETGLLGSTTRETP
ncbi:DUF5994 family protein [Streptomyces sp. NPDC002550]